MTPEISGLRNQRERITLSQDGEGSGNSGFGVGVDWDICVPVCHHIHVCIM